MRGSQLWGAVVCADNLMDVEGAVLLMPEKDVNEGTRVRDCDLKVGRS